MATWAFIRHLGGERATRIFQCSRVLGAITLPSFFWPKSLFAGIDSARHTLSPLPKKFQTREDDTGECLVDERVGSEFLRGVPLYPYTLFIILTVKDN